MWKKEWATQTQTLYYNRSLLYHDPSIPITQNNPNQLINNRSHVLPVADLIEH